MSTRASYRQRVRRERLEWPPRDCIPGSPWTGAQTNRPTDAVRLGTGERGSKQTDAARWEVHGGRNARLPVIVAPFVMETEAAWKAVEGGAVADHAFIATAPTVEALRLELTQGPTRAS